MLELRRTTAGALALLGLLVASLSGAAGEKKEPDPKDKKKPAGKPEIVYYYNLSKDNPAMQFGLALLDKDGSPVPITFARPLADPIGHSNLTVVRVDGKDVIFGHPKAGKWQPQKAALEKGRRGHKS